MTTDTTPAAIAAMLDGVTPGPWFPDYPAYHHGMVQVVGPSLRCIGFTIATDVDAEKARIIKADARFIAASRQLVPALAAERDRLAAENERLRAALSAVERLAISASIASCTCGVKTPEITFHSPNCRYVLLEYIIAQCEDARAVLKGETP